MAAMSANEALAILGRHRTDEVVIATMSAAMLWPRHSRSERDFTHQAPMGAAAAIGLGLAIGRPDTRVLVIDGDGSLLMNLGVLATVADRSPRNFIHVVLENGVHRLTGGQPVSGHGKVVLLEMARAAGYRAVHSFQDAEALDKALPTLLQAPGPSFLSLRISTAFDARDASSVFLSPAGQASHTRAGWTRLRRLLGSTRS